MDAPKQQTEIKRIRRMKFGIIDGVSKQSKFIQDFQKQFCCQFKEVSLVDEVFKKKDENLSIFNNGIRITSYSETDLPLQFIAKIFRNLNSLNLISEVEYVLQKESSLQEYSYSTVKSLDNPSSLLLGLDFESVAKVEISKGLRVDLPHYGMNVLIYQNKNGDMINESNEPQYRVEFNFFYEVIPPQLQREKILMLEKKIEDSFKDTIKKFVEINNKMKDNRGITDLKKLRPIFN